MLYIKNTYKHFDFLEHTYEKYKLEWDWKLGNLWDGQFGYQYNRKLSSFDDFQTPLKDMLQTKEYYLSINRQLTVRWNLFLFTKEQQKRHDLNQRTTLDQDIISAAVNLMYTSKKHSKFGLRAAFKDGGFPNKETSSDQSIDNSYQEHEYRFVVDWNISTQSRLDGSIGYTERSHNEISQRDYSGTTGELNISWYPREKTQISLSLWRDINAYQDATTSYVEESGLKILPVWKITYRQELKLEAGWIDRKYKGDPDSFSFDGSVRDDSLTTTGITYSHSPLDKIKYIFSYKHEKRDSNQAENIYEFNKATASIEISF